MNEFLGCELDGSIVEVTLAKPVDKNQYFRFTRGVSPSALATNLPVMIFFQAKERNYRSALVRDSDTDCGI